MQCMLHRSMKNFVAYWRRSYPVVEKFRSNE